MSFRSPKHRKWVASLPCAICGAVKRSQAAHTYVLGRSIKASDKNVIPLCADSFKGQGCHSKYDQYKFSEDLKTKAKELGRELHKVTLNDIAAFRLLREFRDDI